MGSNKRPLYCSSCICTCEGQMNTEETKDEDESSSTRSPLDSEGEDANVISKSVVWQGELPDRVARGPQNLSRKIFVENLPLNIHDDELFSAFASFNIAKVIRISAPKEARRPSSVIPGGLTFIVLGNDKDAGKLYNQCKYVSDKYRSFQIATSGGLQRVNLSFQERVEIPMRRSDVPSDYTMYVNHLHVLMSCGSLYRVMDDLFGNVKYCQQQADRYGYPTGSAIVVFKNCASFEKALKVSFVLVKTSRYTRMIQLQLYEARSRKRGPTRARKSSSQRPNRSM